MKESDLCWSVYMHTNKLNGKKYVGITSIKPQLRWGSGHGYRGCRRFFFAIQRYGWDAFDHKIIVCGVSKALAEAMERGMIAYYKTNDSKFGYNIQSGGIYSGELSEEGRISLSENATGANAANARPVIVFDLSGKKVEEFACIADAQRFLGAKHIYNHVYSKHGTAMKHIVRLKSDVGDAEQLSEEDVADALSKKYTNGIGARVHAVAVFDAITGDRLGDFPTVKSASEHFKTYFASVLSGAIQTVNGLTIKYAEDCVGVARLSADEINALRINHGEKEVFMFDLDQNFIRSYNSLREAANDTGCSYKALSQCLNGKIKSSGGYLWSYSRSDVPAKTNTIWEARRKNGSKTGTPVDKIDRDTGEVLQTYPSIGLAAKENGTYISSIAEVINHIGNHVSAGGFGWRRHDEGRG